MPISDFLDLMPATITFAHVASRDGYAVPTFAPATSYRARVVYKMIRTSNMFTGQDAFAAGSVWIAGTVVPSDIDDRIVLPDGSMPKILSWEKFPDENGDHHTKIHFGGTGFSGNRG